MEIDPTTGLPSLPSGYRWRVGVSDRYSAIPNNYAVFLEALSPRKRLTVRGWGDVWNRVGFEDIPNPKRRDENTHELAPMVLTKKNILPVAELVFRKWENARAVNPNQAVEQRRLATEAENKFFGTYPPNSL